MLLLVVLLPLLMGTLLTAISGAHRRALTASLAAAITASSLAILVWYAPVVFSGLPVMEHWAWVPSLGLNITFRLDGLSLMLAGLILFIGLCIVLYAAYYLAPEDSAPKFFSLMMLFMAAMLGIVLSDNLLVLVVFWELAGIACCV